LRRVKAHTSTDMSVSIIVGIRNEGSGWGIVTRASPFLSGIQEDGMLMHKAVRRCRCTIVAWSEEHISVLVT
jgi:hypothetical protein